MIVGWLLSALGLLLGAAIGLALVVRPQWARAYLRAEDMKPEARGAFGGLLFASHIVVVLLLAANIGYRDVAIAAINAGAAAALGAGWMGAAAGRLFALWRERALARWRRCLFEAAMSVVIVSPWIFWLVGALGQ